MVSYCDFKMPYREGNFYQTTIFFLSFTETWPYFLKQTSSPNEAQFVTTDFSKIATTDTTNNHLFTSQPFGVISKDLVILLDFETKQSITFDKLLLKDLDGKASKPFNIIRSPIQKVIRCIPKGFWNMTEAPPDNLVRFSYCS